MVSRYAVHVDNTGLRLVPLDVTGRDRRAIHLPLTVDRTGLAANAGVTDAAEPRESRPDRPAEAASRPVFGLGGVPAGVGRAQALWARSWGPRFGGTGSGSWISAWRICASRRVGSASDRISPRGAFQQGNAQNRNDAGPNMTSHAWRPWDNTQEGTDHR